MKKSLALLLGLAFISAFSAKAMADKEWTMLVFLNGHNTLDEAGIFNLNQMETVGSSAEVNVVVEWGSLAQPANTKRLLIKKDNDLNKVTSPVVQDLGKVDMGDPQALKDFFLWGVKNYPAKHYFMVVWDHGSGWHIVNPALKGAVHAQDISYDEISGHVITTEDLGRVIREVSAIMGRRIDIYGSDACLMASAEVASEMTGAVDYFAGSEELEPNNGWPYDTVLADLVRNPQQSPAAISAVLTREYVKLYEGQEEVTFSTFDMSQLARLEQSMADLGAELSGLDKTDLGGVLSDVKATQSFDVDYGDLGDFLLRLQARTSIKSAMILNAQQALHNLVITNAATKGYPLAQGLTVWLPGDAATFNTYKTRYQKLNFNQHSQWINAIAAYLK